MHLAQKEKQIDTMEIMTDIEKIKKVLYNKSQMQGI